MNGGESVINAPIEDQWALDNTIMANVIAEYLNNHPISIQRGGIMRDFEFALSEYIGCKHAVSTNNGTSALLSALFACDLNKDDEVVVPVYCFHGTVIAILQFHAKVVLCDIDPKTLNIDIEDLKRKITDQTKIVIAFHAWGNPSNMDMIKELCSERNIKIISDAVHAFGAEYRNKRIGNIEDIAIYSFGFNKMINAGELGAAVTNDLESFERMLLYGHVNRAPQEITLTKYKDYENSIGPKLRPHTLALAIANQQLVDYDRKKCSSNDVNKALSKGINKIDGFMVQEEMENAERVFFQLPILLDSNGWGGIQPKTIIQALQAEGLAIIENEYNILLDQLNLWNWPTYKGRVISSNNDNAHSINPKIFMIPSYNYLEDEKIEQIIEVFDKVSQSLL